MILLAIDPGERRIGFAICDPEERIASPLRVETIPRNGDAATVIRAVQAETRAEHLILGHPRHLNGRLSPKAREAEKLAETLRKSGLSVTLWDERLTTAEAERAMREAQLSRKERKKALDAVAAQRILQSYLDTK